MPKSTALVAALSLLAILFSGRATATPYKLTNDFFGQTPRDFYNNFDFQTEDPTQGAVTYQPFSQAEASKLAAFLPRKPQSQMGKRGASSPAYHAYVGLDNGEASAAAAAAAAAGASGGIPSVRMVSKQKFNAGTLLVVEASHMPIGPGTWPALWTLGAGKEWPLAGEIDIIEQVNGLPGSTSPPGPNGGTPNSMTLHTGPNCALAANHSHPPAYSGTLVTRNCDVNDPAQDKNAGCSIQSADPNSFGQGFNAAGGGTYAMEWTGQGISVWFWSHADRAAIPSSLAGQSPDPASFGTPQARFDGAGCDWQTAIVDQQLIINLELCGQFAGRVWESSGMAKHTGVASCEQYVKSSGGKGLEDAYWVFDGLRVYSSAG